MEQAGLPSVSMYWSPGAALGDVLGSAPSASLRSRTGTFPARTTPMARTAGGGTMRMSLWLPFLSPHFMNESTSAAETQEAVSQGL